MKLRSLLAAMLVLLSLRGTASAQDTDERLTLAAYNAEWVLDVFDDPYTADEERPPKTREALERVAAAVRATDADVVAFSELENEGVLRELVTQFLGEEGYRYVAAATTNSDRGQNLGVISRLPILSLTSHRFMELPLPGQLRTWRFARDLWKLRVAATDTTTLDLYVVHFKSKRDEPEDPESANWRLAEASAVRRMVGSTMLANPDALVAVMGDFNDTPESPTLATLVTPGSHATPPLLDAHASLPTEERITYLKEPFRSTVDYILVSPALARRMAPGTARVHADPALQGGSDHAPVSASFDLRN